MCYFIKIKIVPEGVEQKAKKHFQMPQSPEKVKVEGEFPTFTLTDGHCACDFVKAKGTTILEKITPFVENLLTCSAVKRVNIIWYWTNFPENADKEKLAIQEFKNRNQRKLLMKDTWFSINDPSKYQRK